MFNKVSCEILPRDTEASHVLTNSTDQTIIKSLQLKDCDAVMSVKKDLQKIKLEDFGQWGGNVIFINKMLCLYYRMLCSESQRLHDLRKFNNYFVSSDKIKKKNYTKPLTVTRAEYFKK